MRKYREFIDVVHQQLEEALSKEDSIDKAVNVFKDCIMADGVIHVFGCGHSQMFGEELCFRTGGLVPVNALKLPQYSIAPKAKFSQVMERQEGVVGGILDSLVLKSSDVMLIVSVSGRNAAGIDMALEAKKRGLKTVGVTSIPYSNSVSSRHSSQKLLKDVCDVVIDLCGVVGDAVLEDSRLPEKFSSTSTIVGMSLLDGVMSEVIYQLLESGFTPPIWTSGNLDQGDALNERFFDTYRDRILIL